MAFDRPTLSELITRTLADFVSRLELTAPVLRRAVVRIFAKVWAGAVHSAHGHLEWVARQILASTADNDQLDRHGADYGIQRTPAAYATGNYTFSGTNTFTAPAGTRIKRSDEREYITQADATIAGGVATVAVKAAEAGADGNSDAGTSMSLISPIAGINAAGVVAVGGLTNGADVESDDNYRARILQRKRSTPQGGSEVDYIRWALEVPGVTRVWTYPQYDGPGTVGLTFVMDDQTPSIIPDGAKVTEVQAYIDDPARRPVTAVVIVFAPVAVPLDLEIELTPNTVAVQDAVEAELIDFLRREGEPDSTLPLSNISEAISSAPGEESHVLSVPAVAPTYGPDEIPVLGNITWL